MINSLEGYTKVCGYNELKEKIGKRFFVDDVEIALFKVDGKVYALNNVCPHQKARLMHEGFIEEGQVVCPVHGWKFELSTGNLAPGRKGLDCYDVKILDDNIFVKVTQKELKW
ncbi:MAG: Rieske 2Fe-2S domain-containing protein [Ignavibacteria bacterium]|nr:Rieske 2Fe-2S domain-containing protein [Ignavibacteria bacterium]